LQSIFIYSRMAKKRSIKEGLQALAGDMRGRRALGFTRRRSHRPAGRRTIHPCLPSESTMSRFLRERWTEDHHVAVYRELDRQLLFEMLELPEVREEARISGMDGSCMPIHHKAPIRDPQTGEIVNHPTALDAGYVPGDGPKSGHGYHVNMIATHRGTVLGWMTGPRHMSEQTMALEMLDEFAEDVKPKLDADHTCVMSGDGGYASNEIREKAQAAGLVPNIHNVSHADRLSSHAERERANTKRIPIDDRGQNPACANWFANGHRELICQCGEGRAEKDVQTRNGKPIISTRGRCKTCGDIRITAGRWKLVQNWKQVGQSAFVPCERGDTPDWSFGNPLTFNDPIAEIYGKGRFGHQEGLHGHLVSGYGLLKGKRWFRRQSQADLDCALVFSILKTLALEKHRRARRAPAMVTGLSPRPPGPAPPAALAA